jgi:hypothetical protein
MEMSRHNPATRRYIKTCAAGIWKLPAAFVVRNIYIFQVTRHRSVPTPKGHTNLAANIPKISSALATVSSARRCQRNSVSRCGSLGGTIDW